MNDLLARARWALAPVLALVACGQPPTPACPTETYPPLAWRSEDVFAAPARRLCLSAAAEATLALSDEAQRLGFDLAAGPPCDLALELSPGGGAPMNLPGEWASHEDGYAWALTDGAPPRLTLFAATARAAHHGAHAILAALGASGSALPRAAADWPRFPRRGVIEGFYNRFFTREERATTLALMHQLRENTYLYAPKDDAWAGYRWWEPYPDAQAADLTAAVAAAARFDIDFVFGISPTLSTNGQDPEASIRFSSAADFDRLTAKLAALRALGVTRFAVLFDDAANTLYHPEDRAAFPSAAAAHADLANRLVAAGYGPLLFVGGRYSSQFDGWQDYLTTLGQRLDPTTTVLWTGPAVFSKTLARADLDEPNRLLGRDVVLWDNWPTSVEPPTGREPQLFQATPGILTNATLVGDFGHPVAGFWQVLGGLGDYAWDPTTYAPADSWRRWVALEPSLIDCTR